MSSNSSKTSGRWESTMGSMKETLGRMTGSAGLQQKGHEQHARGQAKYDKAQGQGYTKATKERVGGVKDSIIGAVQGNEARKAQGKFRRDKGSAQQGLSGL